MVSNASKDSPHIIYVCKVISHHTPLQPSLLLLQQWNDYNTPALRTELTDILIAAARIVIAKYWESDIIISDWLHNVTDFCNMDKFTENLRQTDDSNLLIQTV